MAAKKRSSGSGYDAYKEKQAELSRKRSTKGREIGPLPEVVDPERKARGRESLLYFCQTYFPRRFRLAFAECHLTAIREMESCSEEGGNLAVAMPRGSGKTALAEVALLRAILYGLQRFAVLLQATQPLSKKSFKKIKRELEKNHLLAEDFPEVCYPIERLQGIHNRAGGQTLDGNPTNIEWTADSVVMPTVEGSAASGSIMVVAGIESASRGLSAMLPDGTLIRPGLILADDCQTRETAKSPTQTTDREAIITDDIMGMVGPGESLALIMLCTVIYVNDLSERCLSPDKHPEFRQIRTKMIEAFPANMTLWDEYAEIYRESIRSGDKGRRANAFYDSHRAEMDAGAVVSWPDRKKATDVSGLQSAMNLWITNPRGFKAEYQNEPDAADMGEGAKSMTGEAMQRYSGCARCVVPRECSRVVAFVDVGGELHWYCVVAFTEAFGGSVIDYGSWPRQARSMFAANDPRPGLSYNHPQKTEAERVYAGLQELVPEVLGRAYSRQDTGEAVKIERMLIDCGWQGATVFDWIRQSGFRDLIYASKGVGRSRAQVGVARWKPRPGERSGHHWRLTVSQGSLGVGRMVQFDPDAWKTIVHDLFTTPLGGRKTLTMFGAEGTQHELFGEHCQAESSSLVTLHGDTFDAWAVKPDKPDNHLYDTVVGCAVAASVSGLTWTASETVTAKQPPAKKISLKELQEQRRREKESRTRGVA